MADPGDTLSTAEIIALEAERAPEDWLEDRLEYLSAHPEDPRGQNWGFEPPLVNPTIAACRKHICGSIN